MRSGDPGAVRLSLEHKTLFQSGERDGSSSWVVVWFMWGALVGTCSVFLVGVALTHQEP